MGLHNQFEMIAHNILKFTEKLCDSTNDSAYTLPFRLDIITYNEFIHSETTFVKYKAF